MLTRCYRIWTYRNNALRKAAETVWGAVAPYIICVCTVIWSHGLPFQPLITVFPCNDTEVIVSKNSTSIPTRRWKIKIKEIYNKKKNAILPRFAVVSADQNSPWVRHPKSQPAQILIDNDFINNLSIHKTFKYNRSQAGRGVRYWNDFINDVPEAMK